jgi:hypothetical protein
MIDFPANPTTGQIFTAGGAQWTWDGSKWTYGGGAGGSGASITVSDTPPANPTQGGLWWNSVQGQLYLWYVDPNTSQWVAVTNQMGGAYLPLTGGFMSGPITLSADPAAPLQPVTQQYFSKYPMIGDNRIINGDMRIDQRNNGAAGTANGYTVDRWQYQATSAGKIRWQQVNTTATQFPYALSATSLSAYAAAAADQFQFGQPIEADMVSDFQWGTASAQPVTLSFWTYSDVAGTFSGSICNAAGTRSYPFTYVVPLHVWTKSVIIIPGDTAGTWVMVGNAGAMYVRFDLGCGANSRGPANAWASANYIGATGAASIVATNAVLFYLTGVKLEIGSIATPFNRQSLTKSLADCQRYYQSLFFQIFSSNSGAGNGFNMSFNGPVTLRAIPTATFTGMSYTNASGVAAATLSTSGGSLTAATTANGYSAATGIVNLTAEL